MFVVFLFLRPRPGLMAHLLAVQVWRSGQLVLTHPHPHLLPLGLARLCISGWSACMQTMSVYRAAHLLVYYIHRSRLGLEAVEWVSHNFCVSMGFH